MSHRYPIIHITHKTVNPAFAFGQYLQRVYLTHLATSTSPTRDPVGRCGCDRCRYRQSALEVTYAANTITFALTRYSQPAIRMRDSPRCFTISTRRLKCLVSASGGVQNI